MPTLSNNFSKKQALISLLLFVPASSIGVTMALFIAPGTIGNGIFTVVKIWIVVFPLFWAWKNKPEVLKLPKFSKQQNIVGLLLGSLMFLAILFAYLLVGQQWIDLANIKAKAEAVGIVNPTLYLAGFFYWSFINSFIEECIWRGFVGFHCEILFPKTIGIILAALFFTLHHSIALYGYTQNWAVVILGSFGVFIAGAIWSFCYRKYNSIASCYISHILADIAIGIVGWKLLFS